VADFDPAQSGAEPSGAGLIRAEPAGAEPAEAEPAEVRTLQAGSPLLRRYRRGAVTSWLQACRVVAVDSSGVFCWLPVGAGFGFRQQADGSPVRAAPIKDFTAGRLRLGGWQDRSALIWMPAGRAHSVWWFFAGSEFDGWYVNLEARTGFWRHGGAFGVDVTDHELDLVVAPDRNWQWKDEAELELVTGLPGYWDADGSAGIRAEGRSVLAELAAGRFPFDGSWCDFRPDPGWPVPRLPDPLPDFGWPQR
jgi:hypothetical protein